MPNSLLLYQYAWFLYFLCEYKIFIFSNCFTDKLQNTIILFVDHGQFVI